RPAQRRQAGLVGAVGPVRALEQVHGPLGQLAAAHRGHPGDGELLRHPPARTRRAFLRWVGATRWFLASACRPVTRSLVTAAVVVPAVAWLVARRRVAPVLVPPRWRLGTRPVGG